MPSKGYLRFPTMADLYTNGKKKLSKKVKRHIFQLNNPEGTLLHYAATNDDDRLADLLIGMGIRIDCYNCYSQMPLMIAVKNRSRKTIKILLDANACIDIRDINGHNALQMFFALEQFDLEIFKLFIKKMKRDFSSHKIVKKLIRARCSMCEAVYFRNIEIIKGFLDRGIGIDSRDALNRTPLFFSIQLNDFNLSKYLVDNNANIDALDKHGRSPLHEAAANGNVGIVQLLLEKGAIPNSSYNTDMGMTPLYEVFNNGLIQLDNDYERDECVALLLQHGAVPQDTGNTNVLTLFDLALLSKDSKRKNYLLSSIAMVDRLDGTNLIKSLMRFNREEHHTDFTERSIIKYYESCKNVLDQKFGTLSLFLLLTASDYKMREYMRNKTLTETIEKRCQELDDSYLYYTKILNKRLSKATKAVKLEDAAIPIVCELLNSHYNECYNISKQIVGYLNEHDLEQLPKVFENSNLVTKQNVTIIKKVNSWFRKMFSWS